MKKTILLLIGLILAVQVAAVDMPVASGKYVNDFAGVLNQNQRDDLQALFSHVEANTSAEVVFVSLQTTAPDTPAQFRTKLFNAWHIGKKDADNGLLILYAVQEKRIEVEVGYGLEGILPDSKVGRILDDNYVPLRDQGDVPWGIRQAAHALSAIILENPDEARAGYSTNGMDTITNSLVVLAACLVSWFFVRRLGRPDVQVVLGSTQVTPRHALAATVLILALYFAFRTDLPGLFIVLIAGALTAFWKPDRKFLKKMGFKFAKRKDPKPPNVMNTYTLWVSILGFGWFIVPRWQEFVMEFIAEMFIWLILAFIIGTVHVLRKGKPPKGGFWAGVSGEISSSGGSFGGGSSGGGGAGR